MIKKMILGMFLSWMTIVPVLQSTVIETQEISDVQNYLKDNTLVLFNITSTLYSPSNTMSDNQWRQYFAERIKQVIQNPEIAEKLINQIKGRIVTEVPKKLVQKETPTLIENLQNKKIPVLGTTLKQMSTPYAKNFGYITSSHIKNLGIDLEKTLSYFKIKQPRGDNFTLAYGILFQRNPVGESLVNFLKTNDYQPDQIIMVDNARESLNEVDAALSSAGIPFVGLRYGKADSLKTNFNKTLGTIEFISFINKNVIMSDEEANKILAENPNMDYEVSLNDLIKQLPSNL